MGVLSTRRNGTSSGGDAVLGCLEETGQGLAFRRIGGERRYVRATDDALAELEAQGWDRRRDPQPHAMAVLGARDGEPCLVSLEYVNPHHNID